MTKKQLEIRRKLYDIMLAIGEFEPWNDIDEDVPLIFIPPKSDIQVFFTIIGAHSDVCGVACYLGIENYLMARNRLTSPNTKDEPVICMQNALIGLWGSREDVSKENKALLKELGLKCRGEGGWLHFECYRERYIPRPLNDEEAALLENYLGNLYMMLKSFYEKRMDVNFDERETIFRKYGDNGNWYNIKLEDYTVITDKDIQVIVRETENVKRLAAMPSGKMTIELEETCIPIPKKDKTIGEYFPLFITAADVKTDEIICHRELLPDESRAPALFTIIDELCEQYGKLKEIRINDTFTEELMEDFCQKVGIKLKFQKKELTHTKKALQKEISDFFDADDLDDFMGSLIDSSEDDFLENRRQIKVNKKKKSDSSNTFIISVSLGTGCYRHLKISGGSTLEELHSEILKMFDFDDDHAHAFFLDNKAWSKKEEYIASYMEGNRFSCEYTLDEVLEEKQKFLYIFDFGEEWRFQCRVLKITEEKCSGAQIVRSVGEAPSQYEY